jgi:LCP family protein required for cell wall assembly
MSEPGIRSTAGRDRPGAGPARRALLVALVLLCVPVGAWATPVQPTWSPVTPAPAAAMAPDRLVALELSEPPTDARRPRILLLVGSDSRALVPKRQRRRFGHLTGERADSVMLVELVPARRRVQVLSLPRELQVEVDGHGLQKLNSALTYGGAPGMVDAVRRLTRLPIHHYVELDFSAVAMVVDALGGVTVDFAHPARDLVTGFRALPGPQRLDGAMAVAYARSRQYEELRDGIWARSDASDLGRIRRQQRLLLALRHGHRPPGILGLARTWLRLRGHARFDGLLTFGEAWRLLGDLGSWPVDERNLRTLPTRPAITAASAVSPFPPPHLGAVTFVRPAEPAGSALLEAFGRGDPLPAPPSPEGGATHGR